MIIIGLVGRAGAGKSTVARLFAGHGATVIDADRLAHDALGDPAVAAEVAARFGPSALDSSGRVDRAHLAREVFGLGAAHAAALADLEAIVHPRVRQRLVERIEELGDRKRAADLEPVVVLDVPLLMQAGWDAMCTLCVVVECPEPVRRARLLARGWSEEQIASRDRAWERRFRRPPPGPGTWPVDASGDPAYTAAQVDRVWQAVRGHQGSGG